VWRSTVKRAASVGRGDGRVNVGGVDGAEEIEVLLA
jgi:hypothetical protein